MKNRIALALVPLLLAAATTFVIGCGNSSPSSPTPAAPTKEPAKAPLVHKTEVADWCPEHGVPESICSRCNTKLVAEFQAKGDWCKAHELPESQCFTCHPDLEAKFAAMAPKKGG
jgi:cobalt-zinc-cadmium efflux system membrane fusion protein